MKIISFFNHKGGVSKTTTVYHLGWKLAQLGKRVLMVDTDTQCNLTLTAIGESQYESFITEHPNDNIKSSLDTVFNSRPHLIEAPECVNVKGVDGLFLLPGSFDITEFEVQLGISFQLSNTFSTMNALPGSFYYLFCKCAEKYNIDYILVDMNPSLSAINQDLISSSDYFILPASPDYFSQMAIKSMSRILPQWEVWAKKAREAFIESTYPMPQVTPKFLGYTINDYNIRNGRPTQAFAGVIERVDTIIKSQFYPELEKVDMTIPLARYPQNNMCLATISNFQHLQPKYQEFGLPVFALSDEQIATSGVILAGHQQKREEFNENYANFANKILDLMQ